MLSFMLKKLPPSEMWLIWNIHFIIQFFVFLQCSFLLGVCVHPMLLTWHGVLCIFVRLHIMLSLEICQFLLAGSHHWSTLYTFLCVQTLQSCLLQHIKLHASPMCSYLGQRHIVLPWQIKTCFGSRCNLRSWRKHLGPPTAVDSFLGLTSLNKECTHMTLGSHV